MHTARDKKKSALLVGINKYPCLDSRYQLRGCVNDVILLASVLQEYFGFEKDDIVQLIDEQATRESILGTIDALIHKLEPEDTVVIHYSGHGSQMTDLEGDEPDGLDETIVPYDSGRHPHANRDITDDEIHLLLLRLVEITSNITLIFDCCHSGTITRDTFGAKSRWVEPDLRTAEGLGRSRVTLDHAVRGVTGPSGWLPLGTRYVLFAGCRDNESSFEHCLHQGNDLLYHGALTYFLSRELIDAKKGSTCLEVFEKASACVRAVYSRQHPQLEGARNRVLFQEQETHPTPSAVVTSREGSIIAFAAGAAHGASVGSRWAISGGRDFNAGVADDTLGLVEVIDVHAVDARAVVLGENTSGSIVPGTHAHQIGHIEHDRQLVVAVEGPEEVSGEAAEFRAMVKTSSIVRSCEPNEVADVIAYIIPAREKVLVEDVVPQLGPIREAAIAVVGRDGRLVFPVHALGKKQALSTVCEDLENLARYRFALGLRNNRGKTLLDGSVSMTINVCRGDKWESVEILDSNSHPVLREGERIAFSITNQYTAPVYINILDFGLAGDVSLVYPVAGTQEVLAPGISIDIGTRSGEEMELCIPEGFPYAADPLDPDSGAGYETFKMFVTLREVDFTMLSQKGYREASSHSALYPPGGGLQSLLQCGLTGGGTRDVRRYLVDPVEDWTTVERTIVLVR
jgi:hypothetical protein